MEESFARLLRRFRVRAGLTLSELAEALGAARSSIRAWEQGHRVPRDRARLADLAQVLQLSPTETVTLAAAARSHRNPEMALASRTEADAEAITSSIAPPMPVARYHLRAPVSDFIGRRIERDQLRVALLHAASAGGGAVISSIRGMGGVGKTELAYAVAHDVRNAFPDAQIVVPCRGTNATPLTPAQILQTVIRAFTLDIKLPDDLSALEGFYRSQLANRRVLILADDAHSASQVEPLLPPAGCALLVTSRIRFTLPAITAIDLEQLPPAEAIRLLRAIHSRLAEKEAAILAQACGYLPLALRVSGGLLRNTPALTVTDYLAELADERRRLSLLRDPDDGQRDVESTLTLSYAQLDSAIQAVFRQLGVFVADFGIDLAQAVVTVPEGANLKVSLHHLLRRNLVIYNVDQTRWRLHDLVRDLARHELEAASEQAMVMWRYAQAAVALAEATQDQYQAGGDAQFAALRQFDAERVHFDAARQWAMEQAGTAAGDALLIKDAEATRLIGKLRYDARHERIPQWKRALAAAQRLGNPRAEELALNNLGVAYYELGEFQHALLYLEQRLAIARALDDRHMEGRTLGNLALVYHDLGDMRLAIHNSEQALAISRQLGHQQDEGRALNNLALTYMNLGRTRHAIPYLEQALVIAQTLGDRRSEGIALAALGRAYTDLGEVERAIATCEAAYVIRHEIGDQRGKGYTLSYLARAQALRGDGAQARITFTQATALFHEVGDRSGEAECQWLFGLTLIQHGEREHALPLLRAAVAYEQEIGHAKAAEHAATLARLEAGEALPPELQVPADQRAIGDSQEASTEDDTQP